MGNKLPGALAELQWVESAGSPGWKSAFRPAWCG